MADPTAPLLTLETLVVRPVVVIDGTRYALRAPEALSLLDLHRLRHDGRRLRELLGEADGTEAAATEARALLDALCRWLLEAPAEVHAQLTDTHRLAIVEAFTPLLRASRRLTGGETDAPVATGASSSPDSSASTAGTP